MNTDQNLQTTKPSDSQIAKARANIERFLDKHTREGGIALQHNMVARPPKWRIIAEQPAAAIRE
jgi:hypothetical protein